MHRLGDGGILQQGAEEIAGLVRRQAGRVGQHRHLAVGIAGRRMAHGDVARLAARDGERVPGDVAGHRVGARRLQTQRDETRGARPLQPGAELRGRRDGLVADGRGASSGAGVRSPAGQSPSRSIRLRNSNSLKSATTGPSSKSVSAAASTSIVTGASWRMVAISLEWRARPSLVAQRLLGARRGHGVEVVVDLLDRAVLVEELDGRLIADAGHARDVVGRVTLEALVVDDLNGVDAVAVAHFVGAVVDDRVALIGAVHVDVDAVADELQEVAVEGPDPGLHAALGGLVGDGREDVVGLPACRLRRAGCRRPRRPAGSARSGGAAPPGSDRDGPCSRCRRRGGRSGRRCPSRRPGAWAAAPGRCAAACLTKP